MNHESSLSFFFFQTKCVTLVYIPLGVSDPLVVVCVHHSDWLCEAVLQGHPVQILLYKVNDNVMTFE